MSKQNWVITTLNEITEINPTLEKSLFPDDLTVAFVPMPAVEAGSGKIDVNDTRKFGDVKKGYTPFQKNDILFAKITPCMENGKMAIVPTLSNEIGFGSTEFHVLRSREDIDPSFIYYFVSSEQFRNDAEHNMTGAVGQRRVPTQYLKNHLIPVPPFAEQKRIVAKIEELFSEIDKGIEHLLKAQELLKAYRQSILKNAFEGKLTEKWREENKDNFKSIDPKVTTDLQIIDGIFPMLPKGWSYTQLGTLIEEPKYGTSKKCTYAPGGLGVLRIPNIVNGSIDTTDLKFAQFDDTEKASYNLLSGDLLIIRSNGSVSIVGKCALITENAEKYLFAGYLIRLRPYKHLISPNFLVSLLSSHFLRTQIERKAKSTSGVNNINSSELQSLLIPLCELEEQEIIMKEIGNIQYYVSKLEQEITEQFKKSNLLKQTILKKAFSGDLVSQHPSDEPISRLLESIKADRKSQIKKSRQPKKVAV